MASKTERRVALVVILAVSMVRLTAPVVHQHHGFLFKPRPRKCYAEKNFNAPLDCQIIKSTCCPSLSFLRNSHCYRGTHTHIAEVSDKTGSDFVVKKQRLELNLESFFGGSSQPAFSNNESNKRKPTLLSHRFEVLAYNRKLEAYIDRLNEELEFIVSSNQHPNPFRVEGHIRSHLPNMPDNTFDILNICNVNNQDQLLFPKLTNILFKIVQEIEKSTLRAFLRNFLNSTVSKNKLPIAKGIAKGPYSPLLSSASLNISCIELFASHTSIEQVELHCDTSNRNQNNLQIIAWVPLHNVMANPLIIKDNGGTKTSLCDGVSPIENRNNNYYTSSGMKKGEFLIYLNPATTATVGGATPLLNESPIHGSVELTPHDLENDHKNHRILINMNFANAKIENGW